MKFSEFLNTDQGNTFVNDASIYPTFLKYVKFRFANFHCLYKPDVMLNLLEALMINNQMKLKQIELLSSVTYSLDDLGTTTTSNVTGSSDGKNTDTLSYEGYNTKGDYSKNKSKTKSNSSTQSKTTSIDKILETSQIANFELKRLFDEIDQEMFWLLQTIY